MIFPFKLPSRRTLFIAGIALFSMPFFLAALLYAYAQLVLAPDLPSLDVVTDYRPKIPLRVFTADNVLIGEFGEEHRDFVPVKEIPALMKNAVVAIEDARFYQHGGVDFKGVARAIGANLTGGLPQGASTITMQVARNFLLTRERTATRKLKEIMLAKKIEEKLSKDLILELYMNQIYLGQRTHGFAAAASTYFGKSIKDLSVAEVAMLAGLPQAPATRNPVVNPKRAKQRQKLVLSRMLRLGYISAAQYQQAVQEQLRVLAKGQEFGTHAEYVAEIVRQTLYAQYKEDTYKRGFKVYTTILKADQDAAYEAVRRNVMAYDQRYGYRGPEAFIALPANEAERQDAIDDALQQRPASDRLLPAIVVAASPKTVRAEMASGEQIDVSGEGLRFAAAALAPNAKASVRLKPGAVIRVTQDAKQRWAITQLPEVAAAFVALNPQNGSYRAMVGGFDFNLNQFNHVTQAWRQPGSSIKPFIYSAALEKGFSPSTLISDTPLLISAAETGSQEWAPKNDDGKFDGQVTMRNALAQSKNVASVRILRAITPQYAHGTLARFGFDPAKQPLNLTLALGTGSVTPLQMARAYAVFANGGYETSPLLIQKIVDARGTVITETKPVSAIQDSARILDPRNAFITDLMLREVMRSGTGAAATQKLGRRDLAGKTGTTSDAMDGWFAGYGAETVAVAWMGYDDPRSLGGREFGATLALPVWIDYMRVVLGGKPEFQRPVPANISQVDGDWMFDEYVSGGAVRTLDIENRVAPQNSDEDHRGG